MKSVTTKRRLALRAMSMLAATIAATQAFAVGTPSGVTVGNLATVDYDVGGVAQIAIESSPGGNSTPGPGSGAATGRALGRGPVTC